MSVSELMVTASQRHVLPLQGRPYQEDQVSGLLTIEFLFKDVGLSWEDKDLLPGVYQYISPTIRIWKYVFFFLRSFEAHLFLNKEVRTLQIAQETNQDRTGN